MAIDLNIRHSGDPLRHNRVHIQKNSASLLYNTGKNHYVTLEVTENDTLETLFNKAVKQTQNLSNFSFKFKDTSGKTIHVICNANYWRGRIDATAIEETKGNDKSSQFHACTTTRDSKGLIFSKSYDAIAFEGYTAENGYENISFTQNNEGQIKINIGGRIAFPKNNKDALDFLITKMKDTKKLDFPDKISIDNSTGRPRLMVCGMMFPRDTEISIKNLNNLVKTYDENRREYKAPSMVSHHNHEKIVKDNIESKKRYKRLNSFLNTGDISIYIKNRTNRDDINNGINRLRNDIKNILKNPVLMKNIDIKRLSELLVNAFVSKKSDELKLTSKQTVMDFLNNIRIEAESETNNKDTVAFAKGYLENIMQISGSPPERSIREIINSMGKTYIDNITGTKKDAEEFSIQDRNDSKLFLAPWHKMSQSEKKDNIAKVYEYLKLIEEYNKNFKLDALNEELKNSGIATENTDILMMSYKDAAGNIKPVFLIGGKDKNDRNIFIDPISGHKYSGNKTAIVKEYAKKTELEDGGRLLYLTKDGQEIAVQIDNGQTFDKQVTTILNSLGIGIMLLVPGGGELLAARLSATSLSILKAAPSILFGASASYSLADKIMDGNKVSTQEVIETVIISVVAIGGGGKEFAQLFVGAKDTKKVMSVIIKGLNTAEMSGALAMTGYIIPQGLNDAFLNDKTASDEAKLNFLFNVALVIKAVKFNNRMEELIKQKCSKEDALIIIAKENNTNKDVVEKVSSIIDDVDELIASNPLGRTYAREISKTKGNIATKSGEPGKHYQYEPSNNMGVKEHTKVAEEDKDENKKKKRKINSRGL